MADTTPINIPALSAKERAEMRESEKHLKALERARDNLKEAGIDTADLDKTLEHMRAATDFLKKATEELR